MINGLPSPVLSIPIPGLNRTFVIPNITSDPLTWCDDRHGPSKEKRMKAKEVKRIKKLHRKQGRH